MGRTIGRATENDKGQRRHQDQNPSGPSAATSRSHPDFENLFLIVLHTTMKSPLVSPRSTVRPSLIESSMAQTICVTSTPWSMPEQSLPSVRGAG
jgi:hypothetical protein